MRTSKLDYLPDKNNSIDTVDPNTLDPEHLLVYMTKKGDRAAQDTLIRSYQTFVERLAFYYLNRGASERELLQAGYMAIWLKAVPGFDFGRGVLFKTFATACIKKEMYFCVRKYKADPRRDFFDSIDELPSSANDSSTPETHLEAIERRTFIRSRVLALMDMLTPKQQRVIKVKYGLDGEDDDLPYRELGTKLDLTGSRVHQLNKKATSRLKRFLKFDDGVNDILRKTGS
jgi:RNA polymerase sigma factor (sigma-70 family)